jgi:hypothetical protein
MGLYDSQNAVYTITLEFPYQILLLEKWKLTINKIMRPFMFVCPSVGSRSQGFTDEATVPVT